MKKLLFLLIIPLLGCTTMSRVVNPFYEPPSETALLGQPNDHALNSTESKSQNARQALEQMSTYRKAQQPQPLNPVMQPAVVRVMWIPDDLNSKGDLVPAHYYYLKVLGDRWAVQDAFELESQLNGPGGKAGNVPYVYEGKR